MTTRTIVANRSSLLARSGSTDLGGGRDTHLDVGAGYGGYTFRSVLDFPAIDWALISSLTKATLRLRVASGEHLAKVSGSDLEVRRATEQWSPNSASSGHDSPPGGGWSTSGAVYPGPSTSGTVTRANVSTSDGATIDCNVLALVLQWAPTRIPGGGGAAKYGFVLVAASGSMEFRSAETSYEPELLLEYTSDPPNTPTITAPTGKSADRTPTFVATATHPQNAPISAYDLETRIVGSGLDYAVYGQGAGIGAGTITHTPPADLAPGSREVRVRIFGGGLWSSWSSWSAYAIDRPPAFGSWSAPPATVGGTRRPVHTFTGSDPDGDPLEYFDLEVYPAESGAPIAGAAAVYRVTNISFGIAGGTINHTPGADLPGGELVARARVRAAGVWGAWGPYRAYTVTITQPAVSWLSPAVDHGYLEASSPDLTNPETVAIGAVRFVWRVNVKPPAGFVMSSTRMKITRLDGPGAPAVIIDAVVSVDAAGIATGAQSIAGWAGQLFGRVLLEVTATSSNGGVLNASRTGRWAWGEWFGAAALGDAASGLTVAELAKGDIVRTFYRAQTSATAPASGAVWLMNVGDNLAAVEAKLPATNAYLGLRLRLARLLEDPELLANGDFEAGNFLPWIVTGGVVGVSYAASGAPAGDYFVVVTGDGGASNPGLSQRVPVLPGMTYRAAVWARSPNASDIARLQLVARSSAGATVNASALIVNTSLAAWTLLSGVYTVPADGSVGILEVLLRIPTLIAGQSVRFDGASLTGPAPGDGGMDRLQLGWSSLG